MRLNKQAYSRQQRTLGSRLRHWDLSWKHWGVTVAFSKTGNRHDQICILERSFWQQGEHMIEAGWSGGKGGHLLE